MSNPTVASNWLIKNKLIVGRHPRDENEIVELIDAGVVLFVNLTELTEKLFDYDDILEDNNIEYIKFPIKDRSIENDEKTLDFVNLIYDKYNKLKNQAIYIHCKGGLGRTGIILGCLLSKILKINNYKEIWNVMNDSLKTRKYKMISKNRMKYYKSPQTIVQIQQLKRLCKMT